MSNNADKRFGRYVDAVNTMYGQCAQCGGNLTSDHQCPRLSDTEKTYPEMFRCKICGTIWRRHAHVWSLNNPMQKPGACCDNHPGFLSVIEPIRECLSRIASRSAEYDKSRNLENIIANQSKRIEEFDSCIHHVAEALGACCGGVDGDQTKEGATTRVLLEKIAELKERAVHPGVQEARDFVNDRRKSLLKKSAPRTECPGCFCAIYDMARDQGWCADCYPCRGKYIEGNRGYIEGNRGSLPDGVSI